MKDTSSIDGFLAGKLRELRGGTAADWPFDAEIEWQAVWSRIEYHGIPLALHRHADQLKDWPQALLARIAEEARLIVLWETTHHSVVAELLQKLDAAGLESVIMKGTALAYSFHDEPATRRRGDTDLLVRPENQDRTRAILSELGWYRKEDPHGLYYQEGWLHDAAGFFVHSIDLHWEPSDRPVLHSVLPMNSFFAGKKPMPQFGEGAYRPDTATMVVHATINQKWHSQHGYYSEGGRLTSPRRLIWSVDFDLMAASMTDDDWAQLTTHCAREGIGPIVAEALRGAGQDLEITLPQDAIEQLQAGPLHPDLQTHFSNSDNLSEFWLDLRKTVGLRKKGHLIAARAMPPRTHLIEKYPGAKGWPTVLLQGRLLLGTAGRVLRRVISR